MKPQGIEQAWPTLKIYTRTGDRGETGLIGGIRVSKSDDAIRACGDLDETNCSIGVVLSSPLPDEITERLVPVQHDLFVLGSQVAACRADSGRDRAVDLDPERVSWLEQAIDCFDAELPAMDAFILPGGSPAGAQLHAARSVCRRAERSVVELAHCVKPPEYLSPAMVYLNRLSDLLFVLARYVNHREGMPETKWRP